MMLGKGFGLSPKKELMEDDGGGLYKAVDGDRQTN